MRFMALATSLATPGSAMSPRVRKPWSMVRKGSMVIPTPCTGHMSGDDLCRQGGLIQPPGLHIVGVRLGGEDQLGGCDLEVGG